MRPSFLVRFLVRSSLAILGHIFFLVPCASSLPIAIRPTGASASIANTPGLAGVESMAPLRVRMIERSLSRRSFQIGDIIVRKTNTRSHIISPRRNTLVVTGELYPSLDAAKAREGTIGHIVLTKTYLDLGRGGRKRRSSWYGLLDLPELPRTLRTRSSGAVEVAINPERNGASCGTLPDTEGPRQEAHSTVRGTDRVTHSAPELSQSLAADTSPEAGSIVDLLVLYTSAARDAAGGTSGIISEIAAAVASANIGLKASQIVGASYRVVAVEETSYNDAPNQSQAWVKEMTNPSSSYAAAVKSRRDQLGADIVGVVMQSKDPYCGITHQLWGDHVATTGGCYQYPGVPRSTCTPASDRAFLAVSRQCFARHSLLHELGHQGGAQHHFDEVQTLSGIKLCGVFPDACGHSFMDAEGIPYRSVMASDPALGVRINQFSNAAVAFQGATTGVSGQRDNARAVRATFSFVASYRTTPAPIATPVPTATATPDTTPTVIPPSPTPILQTSTPTPSATSSPTPIPPPALEPEPEATTAVVATAIPMPPTTSPAPEIIAPEIIPEAPLPSTPGATTRLPGEDGQMPSPNSAAAGSGNSSARGPNLTLVKTGGTEAATASPSGKGTIFVLNVQNIGAITSPPTSVMVKYGRVTLGRRSTPAIKAGGVARVLIRSNFKLRAGSQLTARVDPENFIVETDEKDNAVRWRWQRKRKKERR